MQAGELVTRRGYIYVGVFEFAGCIRNHDAITHVSEFRHVEAVLFQNTDRFVLARNGLGHLRDPGGICSDAVDQVQADLAQFRHGGDKALHIDLREHHGRGHRRLAGLRRCSRRGDEPCGDEGCHCDRKGQHAGERKLNWRGLSYGGIARHLSLVPSLGLIVHS